MVSLTEGILVRLHLTKPTNRGHATLSRYTAEVCKGGKIRSKCTYFSETSGGLPLRT